MDIIILGSLVNAVFVAKSDIRNWPIINKLCMLGKTIFIERENRRSVKKQAVLIKENMENGLNVILFPEGTSSDGSKVLSFKSSLFEVVDHQELRNYKLQQLFLRFGRKGSRFRKKLQVLASIRKVLSKGLKISQEITSCNYYS